MKNILLSLFAITLTAQASFGGNWFGSGPWANAAYYPGALDGKYQASVTGVNTAGVLGFAIRDGSVPFLQIETQSTGDALVTDSVVVNQDLQIDESVNYYAIFVNGRTYTGTTAAGININANSISGTLLGTQPTTLTNTNTTITSILLTNTTVTGGLTNTTVTTEFATNSVLDPVLIATGVDGAFQANVTGKNDIFTFQGPGQLTSPAPIINGQQTTSAATAFTVNGIRTSFSSESVFQSVNSSPAQ